MWITLVVVFVLACGLLPVAVYLAVKNRNRFNDKDK